MSDQDVFASEDATPVTPDDQSGTPAPVVEPVTPAPDAFADQLASIVNADGTPKYTDVASALESIPNAQKHISTIESENAELRASLAKAEAAKELLEKSAGNTNQSQGLTADEVAKITQDTLAAQQDATQRAENVNAVSAKFSELYGDKAVDQMKQVAADAGMSVAAVKELAERSPQAVLKLAGISPEPASGTPPRSPGVGVGDNFQPPKPDPTPPKAVMGGASTQDMIQNWRAAGEIIKNR